MVNPEPISWTLVTVTYNSAETLAKFWTRPPAWVEWIVVDNSSTDSSAEAAESLGAQVIRLPENRGFSAANNAGLREAVGEFVAFVNPDVTVDYDAMPVMEEVLRERRALVAPQLHNPDGSMQPNGRGAPILWNKIRNRLPHPESLAETYLLYADRGELREISWAMGAAVAGRTELVRELGGWNERFFLYYEDKDFCLRAARLGIPTYLCGDAVWTHGWARETKGIRLKPWLREIRSMALFYRLYPQYLLLASRSTRSGSGSER